MRYTEETQKIILNVLEYFKKESKLVKEKKAIPVPLTSVLERAAAALKVSKATLCRLQAGKGKTDYDFSKQMSEKIRACKIKQNAAIFSTIRQTIYKMYAAKDHITIKTLRLRLIAEYGEDFSYSESTLNRWLLKIGFTWKKSNNRRFLMEKPDVQMKRTKFLSNFMANLNSDVPLNPVYLDETWTFSKGSHRNTWQDNTLNTCSSKTGDGYRYIVVNAGNQHGFVKNSNLIFKANKKTGDYHENMNRENFEKWFKCALLPNLTSPQLICMDNASYHSALENPVPTKSWTKAKLLNWLSSKGVQCLHSLLKHEVWSIAKTILPEKEYHLDKYVLSMGHKILRLPPYHCHYSPIEMVWSQCKRWYDHEILKTNGTEEEVIRIWNKALEQVTQEQWQHYVEHCEKIIKNDWEIEKHIAVTDMEPIIINTGEDSDSEVESNYESDSDNSE